MNADVYKFDISRATDAGTLHAYREDAAADPELTPEELQAIGKAIDNRFGFLNRQKLGHPKPRWGA